MIWKCDSCGKHERTKGVLMPIGWSDCQIASYRRRACNRGCLTNLVYRWLGIDTEGFFDGMWQDVPVDKNIL